MTYRLRWWTNTSPSWIDGDTAYATKSMACGNARHRIAEDGTVVKCIVLHDGKYVTGYVRDWCGPVKRIRIRKPKAVQP